MIAVIIKTVVLTLCILVVLIIYFCRKYDFCMWERCKTKEVYISNSKYVYDRFKDLVNNDNTKCRSRIELDYANNIICIETKDSPEVLTYTFSKYRFTDIDEKGITYVEFVFENGISYYHYLQDMKYPIFLKLTYLNTIWDIG